MQIILASTSARRRELLALLQLPFGTVDPLFEERLRPDLDPAAQAAVFAERKAQSCAGRFPDSLVIGSDTLIALGSEAIGKPRDLDEARAVLRRLRGRLHVIYTAVTLIQRSRDLGDLIVEPVRVWMRLLSDEEIDGYLRTGEPMGKAGAYAIQGVGGGLIDRIEGDYTAAVGLPLRRLADLLGRRGVHLPVDVEELYRIRPYSNWNRFASSPP